MRTIDDLIDALEWGLDRSEEPTWVAATIFADDDGQALLNDLKDARDKRNLTAEQ